MTLIKHSLESTILFRPNWLIFQALAHCSRAPFRTRHALVNKDLWQLLDSNETKNQVTLMMHCLLLYPSYA